MRQFIVLTKRHIQLFFAERSNIIFTCLSSLIVLAMYMFFLMDMQVNNLSSAIATASNDEIFAFLGNWLLAGQLVLVIFSSTFSAMSQYISDSEYNGSDIQIFPMAKWKIIVTYCVQAVIISLIFSLVSFAIGTGFIWLKVGYFVPFTQLPLIFTVILIGSIFSSVLAMLCVLTVRTMRSYGSLQTLLNTLMGFLIGLYLSTSLFPTFVQKIIPWNPFMSLAVLLRSLLAGPSFDVLFEGVPAADVYEAALSFNLKVESFNTAWSHFQLAGFMLVVSLVVFAVLVVMFAKRTYKR